MADFRGPPHQSIPAGASRVPLKLWEGDVHMVVVPPNALVSQTMDELKKNEREDGYALLKSHADDFLDLPAYTISFIQNIPHIITKHGVYQAWKNDEEFKTFLRSNRCLIVPDYQDLMCHDEDFMNAVNVFFKNDIFKNQREELLKLVPVYPIARSLCLMPSHVSRTQIIIVFSCVVI